MTSYPIPLIFSFCFDRSLKKCMNLIFLAQDKQYFAAKNDKRKCNCDSFYICSIRYTFCLSEGEGYKYPLFLEMDFYSL